jgi:hypothetical protein
VTSAVEPRVDGEVSSVVSVLQEVAVEAEAVGEGQVVQGVAAWKS